MQKMQPSSASSSVDVLQGVHDSVSELVQQVANEPSVGLFFVQQHVHKAVPGLLTIKNKLAEDTQEALLYTEDAKDTLTAVKSMKECGPPAVNSMIAMLTASVSFLPSLHRHPKSSGGHPPSGYTTLSRATTYHGPTSLPGAQPDAKPTIRGEGSLENAPRRSTSMATASTRVPLQPPSTSKTSPQTVVDSSGYVTTLFNSAYQRASSSMRKSVSGSTLVSQEASPKAEEEAANFMSTAESNPNNNTAIGPKQTSSSSSSADVNLDLKSASRSVWSVLESAMQRAGNMVVAGTGGGGGGGAAVVVGTRGIFSESSPVLPTPEQNSAPMTLLQNVFDSAEVRADGETEADSEEVDDRPGLDLENPEVVENYEKLCAEHTAKLEAWLANSKDSKES